MTIETLEKANEIKNEINKLTVECERLPRQYLDWRDKKHGYWKRMLVGIGNKIFVRFPQNYEGGKNIIMELNEEDLNALVELREKKIELLNQELEKLN
ncbi:hypothetical protein [Lacrimispora amygdalina]|uniref:hypothetical protein n=1 Tax=Lacrimispora amygdalina TaxID=253257 RepID=UPI000BE3D248|nr:hypothetical protein [Lacrimispora amygdalina]